MNILAAGSSATLQPLHHLKSERPYFKANGRIINCEKNILLKMELEKMLGRIADTVGAFSPGTGIIHSNSMKHAIKGGKKTHLFDEVKEY